MQADSESESSSSSSSSGDEDEKGGHAEPETSVQIDYIYKPPPIFNIKIEKDEEINIEQLQSKIDEYIKKAHMIEPEVQEH